MSYFISHARGDRETGLKSFMSFRNRNWSKFNRAEQMKAEAAEQLFKRIVK